MSINNLSIIQLVQLGLTLIGFLGWGFFSLCLFGLLVLSKRWVSVTLSASVRDLVVELREDEKDNSDASAQLLRRP